MTATDATPPSPAPNANLRRELGYWRLTGVAMGGCVGSGWLFSAAYGAQAAGPAAVLSWVIAGVAMTLVALVLIELGGGSPEAGGLVRWPSLANGPLVGVVVGWIMLLGVSTIMAAQASAVVQYADHYLPGLYGGGGLSPAGKATAAALLAVLVALNWFGVRLFAGLNLFVTVVKVLVPALTVVALLVAGSHPGNIAAGGGLAPQGWSAALVAIASAGIIYALDGFAAPVELSAEARDARRDVPRAVLTGIGLTLVLNIALQVVFILAVPTSSLAAGWGGLVFSSPFGELALLLDLAWLAAIIYASAVFSPSGSTYVIVAAGSRETYAAARNDVLPRRFAVVSDRAGVPRAAMALNFVLSVVFLLPNGGWQRIIGVVGALAALAYSLCTVAAGVFRAAAPERLAGWVGGLGWIAPAGFVVASELVYWSSWPNLRIAMPVLAVAVGVTVGLRGMATWAELPGAAWIAGYAIWLFTLSACGSFGGAGLIPAPWDTVAVAVLGVLTHRWGVRSGVARAARPPGAQR